LKYRFAQASHESLARTDRMPHLCTNAGRVCAAVADSQERLAEELAAARRALAQVGVNVMLNGIELTVPSRTNAGR
jgi:hypothetical protein